MQGWVSTTILAGIAAAYRLLQGLDGQLLIRLPFCHGPNGFLMRV